MSRSKSGKVTKNRHRKILKMAKGYVGRASTCYRIALERVEKAMQYAYRDRKNRKRDFRGLWIQRINAAVRSHGFTYSQFIGVMHKANIGLNRKMLAEIAVNHPDDFTNVVNMVKAAA